MAIVGSTWVVEPVSIPSIANPDMECVRLMLPSTLVGGVCHPVSSLYSGCAVWWTEYSMPLSSDTGEVIPVISVGVVDCMLELPSDFGFPALLDGEYRHSIPQARQREHIGLALEHLTLA